MALSRIEDVVAEMTRRCRRLDEAMDWRAVFADAYLRTTHAVLHATRGLVFRDPSWVVRIDVDFAERYFDAFDAWTHGRPCPSAWRLAFQSAVGKRTLVLQDVLLGMNAHINYDLPHALDATIPAGLSDGDLEPFLHDHRRLNGVLAGAVDDIERDVAQKYDPALRVADALLGRADEGGAAALVRVWRERVWEHFRLLRAGGDRRLVEDHIERSAAETARILLGLRSALPPIFWANRVYRDGVSWLRLRLPFRGTAAPA